MPNQRRPPTIDWGRIKNLTVDGTTLRILYADGRKVILEFESRAEMLEVLEKRRDREK